MGAAFSIDRAASGFLRHRFMRALGAAWIALILVGLLATIGYSVTTLFFGTGSLFPDIPNSAGALYLLAFAYVAALAAVIVFSPIVLIVVFLPAFLFTTIWGAAVDSLHRRLAALIALPVCVTIFVVAVLGVLAAIFIPDPSPTPMQRSTLVAVAALLGLAGLVAWQGAGWAWWQLTVSREEFLAARGYRPAPRNLLRTFRRQLDLPPFISFLGGRRLSAVWLYFAEALLNAGLVCPFVLVALYIALSEDRTYLAGPEGRAGFFVAVSLFAGLLLLYLFGAGRLIRRFAGRQAARLYQDVRDWDARAPVLFLRDSTLGGGVLPARTVDPIVKFPTGVGSARTIDEILLENASNYGPVITVGDPHYPAPRLGPARIFAPDETQGRQEMVAAQIRGSKAVVICPNDAEDGKWPLDLIEREGAQTRTIYLADPAIAASTTETLFARLAPEGAAPTLPARQKTIAAFVDPNGAWRVLTTSRPPCVQTHAVALNMALQAVLGEANPSRVVFRTKEEMRDVVKAFREGRGVTLFSDG